MFGLTEQEMDNFLGLAQDFAVMNVAQEVRNSAQFIIPATHEDGKTIPNTMYLSHLLTDLEFIITLTSVNMSYEYAHLQCETDLNEEEIINYLHNKFEDFLFRQFIKYGLAPTSDVISEVVGEIILELPYLYAEAIEDEDFDEDVFLEEKLKAYNKYLDENFSYPDDEDNDSGEDE